jgi:phage/plasmid-like protein (TIGR03299 family)
MSHEITATDKVFTVGEQAWHGLDDNRKGQRLTAEEAKAYLDWRVKKVPAKYEGKPVDGAYYTVREDTDAVLGVVGSQYSVIQNDWLFKLLEPVVNDGACLYETGGSLMGGRKVWALAKLPQAHYIVKDDRVDQYILVTIAHDGSLMFTALYTDVRVVCNNTLTTALNIGGGAHPVVRIKHTPGYRFQAQIAHKILGLSTKASAQAAIFFAELAAKSMNSVELTQFAKYLFPSVRENDGKEADARIFVHVVMPMTNADTWSFAEMPEYADMDKSLLAHVPGPFGVEDEAGEYDDLLSAIEACEEAAAAKTTLLHVLRLPERIPVWEIDRRDFGGPAEETPA